MSSPCTVGTPSKDFELTYRFQRISHFVMGDSDPETWGDRPRPSSSSSSDEDEDRRRESSSGSGSDTSSGGIDIY